MAHIKALGRVGFIRWIDRRQKGGRGRGSSFHPPSSFNAIGAQRCEGRSRDKRDGDLKVEARVLYEKDGRVRVPRGI
jgi:hypothetical protein